MSVGGVWQQHTILPVIETSDVYYNVVGRALETRRLLDTRLVLEETSHDRALA